MHPASDRRPDDRPGARRYRPIHRRPDPPAHRDRPRDCDVEGIVSASSPEETRTCHDRAPRPGPPAQDDSVAPRARPGLAARHRPPRPANGMVHAPSLLAPLRRARPGQRRQPDGRDHPRRVPWTHPETLTPHGSRLAQGDGQARAQARGRGRRSDARGGRRSSTGISISATESGSSAVRSAADSRFPPTPTAARTTRAARRIPAHRRNARAAQGTRPAHPCLASAGRARPPAADRRDRQGWGDLDLAQVADEAGVAPDRVRALGFLDDSDLAVVSRARDGVRVPEPRRGFRAAPHRGVLVRHARRALGCARPRRGGRRRGHRGARARMRPAIRSGSPRPSAACSTDRALRERLGVFGSDRSRAFSWRDSAERVWQLHADL